ncbi:MAG: GNAT family N-acetyltransferase [Actinomycetota bacterium]
MIPDGITFRRARPEEAPSIARLINSAYRGEGSRAGWATEADFLEGIRTNDDEIGDLIRKADSFFLLACEHDRVIGCVHLERIDDERAYLGMFVVEPGLQARGAGKRLLQEAETAVRSPWHARWMRMWVLSVRVELIAFYERRGYQATGAREPWPEDATLSTPLVEGLEFVILEKDLTS